MRIPERCWEFNDVSQNSAADCRLLNDWTWHMLAVRSEVRVSPESGQMWTLSRVYPRIRTNMTGGLF